MERLTRSILRNKIAGPIKRKAVKGYLVHRSAPQTLPKHGSARAFLEACGVHIRACNIS